MTKTKTREEEEGLDSKIVLLGDSGVGKTSLVQRYVQQNFIEKQQPTIGASFLSRTIFLEERRIKMRLWDTAGQEKFRSLAPMYYRDASVALIVFDLTNRRSFDLIPSWTNELKTNLSSIPLIVVVGNKVDSPERQVDQNEAKHVSESEGALYFEVSAMESTGVEEMFLEIAKNLLKAFPVENHSHSKDSIRLNGSSSRRNGTCC